MIDYCYKGVPHPSKPCVWLAQFQAPSVGTRYVRGEDGAPVIFRTQEAASSAALAVMMRTLNGPGRNPVAGKALEVSRNNHRGKWVVPQFEIISG